MGYTWFKSTSGKTPPVFFSFTAVPHATFCFDGISSLCGTVSHRSLKRRRPLWDIDGGLCERKKKRRLRLNLVTSRLSQPYSCPATNIIGRGASKVAVWAKTKKLDKDILRKAAIMNKMRRSPQVMQAIKFVKDAATAQIKALRKQVDWPKPRPSPLGLSNYDALDLEDEMMNDGESNDSEIYSDFSIMKPTSAEGGNVCDSLDEPDGIPCRFYHCRPPQLPDDHLVDFQQGTGCKMGELRLAEFYE